MAKLTYQGLLRTFVGRAKSATDRRSNLPRNLLPQNLDGPIQVVLQDPADDSHDVGLLPAGFAIDRITVITAAGAGSFALDTPAYGDVAAATLVAAALGNAATAGADLAIAARRLDPYPVDIPLIVTTTGVTGLLRIGIFGFPVDDATQVD